MERADANCILCDSQGKSLLIRQGEWSVYRCSVCGLGFLDPRPNAKELGTLYGDGYFDDQYGHGLAIGSPEMKKRLSQESHRIRFFRRVKRSGKVLDIGCGMGYFLLACRDAGYDVEGMDARKTWACWKGWRLPYRLYHFTPETLRKLLTNHGLGTVRSKKYLVFLDEIGRHGR